MKNGTFDFDDMETLFCRTVGPGDCPLLNKKKKERCGRLARPELACQTDMTNMLEPIAFEQ